MNEKRKSEIALILLKNWYAKELRISNLDFEYLTKRIGDVASETGLPRKELLQFTKEILSEVLTEAKEVLRSVEFKD